MRKQSFAWMRRIDIWIANPLARILCLFTSKPRCPNGDQEIGGLPKRVICAKFTGSGNVVHCLPLLRALKENGVSVAFWTFREQAELLQLSGIVDEIYVIRPTLKSFVPTLIRSWFRARGFKPDAFLDLEFNSNFSAILARLSRAKIKIGFLSGLAFRKNLFTHLVSLVPFNHRVGNYQALVRRLGLPENAASLMPPVPNLASLKNILPHLVNRRRIIVHLFSLSKCHIRMWSEDSWVETCNRLLEDIRVDLIFTGAKEDRDTVQILIARLKDPARIFNLAGDLSLVEHLRLLQEVDLLVSVESGLVHLAAWVTTPKVVLFWSRPSCALLFSCNSFDIIMARSSVWALHELGNWRASKLPRQPMYEATHT